MEAADGTNDARCARHVRPVERHEEARYQEQMARHHDLGALPKIGHTVWSVAPWRDQWVAPLSRSGAALKCGVRARWIGWDFRTQYGRLTVLAKNRRFLILPDWHRSTLGSRVRAWTARRIGADGQARFGHPCCCWSPLSIPGAAMAASIAPPTGSSWD